MLKLIFGLDENSITRVYSILQNRGLNNNRIINEILRILYLRDKIKFTNKESLYSAMKENTDGNFPGDEEFFYEIYNLAKDINIFTLINYYIVNNPNDSKNRRQSYQSLFTNISMYFKKAIEKYNPQSILILEPEKFVEELPVLIEQSKDKKFVILTGDKLLKKAFCLAFEKRENVEVSTFDITSESIILPEADLTISMNVFYTFREGKWKLIRNINELWNRIIKNIKKDDYYCFLYLDDMFVNDKLDILRGNLLENFHIQSINNIYIKRGYGFISRLVNVIEIKNEKVDDNYTVDIVSWTVDKNKNYFKNNSIVKNRNELKNIEKWEYDYILKVSEGNLLKYKNSKVEKIKLKNIADIIRGGMFSSSKNSEGDKEIDLINISALDDEGIDLSKLGKIGIRQKQFQLDKYLIREGDLILTCRGTSLKMAIVPKMERDTTIASNLIYIRPNKDNDSRYLKLFFESEIGQLIFETINTQGMILSIRPKSLGEIEIPAISLKKQHEIIDKYIEERAKYKNTIKKATDLFDNAKKGIYEKIINE
jgi:hypothetical protein